MEYIRQHSLEGGRKAGGGLPQGFLDVLLLLRLVFDPPEALRELFQPAVRWLRRVREMLHE